MKKMLIIVIMCVLLFSCEKDINFKLNAAPTVLVVDAQIENGKAPIVILNNSFSFFDSINPQLLSGSFVHDATVTISNGTLTHQLKEYSYGVTPGIRVY